MISRPFGALPSGKPVEAYTLTAGTASLEVLNYGGIVTSLRVPDRHGRQADVVLGFARLEPYLASHSYFGAIVGRIAGRVTAGRIMIDGRSFQLPCNDGGCHLHGGYIGLDQRLWLARAVERTGGSDSLQLIYRSPDGEAGYPGNLDLTVTYTLTSANEFIIETEACADEVTPLSLAHHSYFNLAGEDSGSIAGHEIQVTADALVPVNEKLILSDRREPLAGQPGDFSQACRLGDVLPRLVQAHGDLYLLRKPHVETVVTPTLAARIVEPLSGRVLEVFTNESCLQFYTGSGLGGSPAGKSGRAYGPHAGLCFECQGYPNGAEHPGSAISSCIRALRNNAERSTPSPLAKVAAAPRTVETCATIHTDRHVAPSHLIVTKLSGFFAGKRMTEAAGTPRKPKSRGEGNDHADVRLGVIWAARRSFRRFGQPERAANSGGRFPEPRLPSGPLHPARPAKPCLRPAARRRRSPTRGPFWLVASQGPSDGRDTGWPPDRRYDRSLGW